MDLMDLAHKQDCIIEQEKAFLQQPYSQALNGSMDLLGQLVHHYYMV